MFAPVTKLLDYLTLLFQWAAVGTVDEAVFRPIAPRSLKTHWSHLHGPPDCRYWVLVGFESCATKFRSVALEISGDVEKTQGPSRHELYLVRH